LFAAYPRTQGSGGSSSSSSGSGGSSVSSPGRWGGGSFNSNGGGVVGKETPYTKSFSSSKINSAMSGGSWGAKGSGRTSGGSRLYTIKARHYSPGPRTYYGGQGFRGPRYYNGARVTALTAGTAVGLVAATWVASSPRYGFYDASYSCQREGFFRFGDTCRQCSRGVCPDGQYRVACTGLFLSLSRSLACNVGECAFGQTCLHVCLCTYARYVYV
jgi:hypothetical protein